MKKLVFILLFLIPSTAYAENFHFQLDNKVYNKRFYRGFVESDAKPVLQNDLSLSYYGFSVSFFSNYNTKVKDFDELSFALSYSLTFKKYWTVEVGYAIMAYLYSDEYRSQEVFGILTFNKFVKISLLSLYDWDFGTGAYFQLSVSREMQLWKWFGLGMKFGIACNHKYYREKSGVSNALWQLTFPVKFNKYISLIPEMTYSQGLAEDMESGFYAGVNLRLSASK